MNKDLNVTACRPGDLSPSERAACVRIVRKGSAVNPESAAHEIPRAVLIAIVRDGGEIVGTGAIKRKRKKYACDIALCSEYSFDSDTRELGYVAVNEKQRGKHLSDKILAALLSQYDRPLFATTGNERMKSALKKAGFQRKGNDWRGNTGRLSLWLRV